MLLNTMTLKSLPLNSTTLKVLAAGALGGFAGFLLSEAFAAPTAINSFGELLRSSARWSGLIALGLGSVLTVAENHLSLRGRPWRGLWYLAPAAGVLGWLGGFLGQFFYSVAGASSFTRGIGWALVGAGMGLMLGLGDRSKQKAIRGALGGTAGGFIGGFLFNSIFALSSAGGGTLARMVGLTITGAAIGLMLRLTQEFFKDAWLMGTSLGPYEGKSFILSKNSVTVGRSDGNDIGLYREPDVPMTAGAFVEREGVWYWQGDGVLVNGRLEREVALAAGDRLRFGSSEFTFGLKRTAPAGVPAERYMLHGDTAAYPLPPTGQVTLGRAQGNSIVLADASVAERQARLTVAADGVTLEHMSGNTLLNDEALRPNERRVLKPGDLILLGGLELALLRQQ